MSANAFDQESRPTVAWLWQVVTGVGLVFLLGLHMVANHFIAKGGLRDYAAVVAYLRHPIILLLEILFLVCVTTHALLGVRAIFLDFGLSERIEQIVTRVLKWIGILTVVYGLVVMWFVIR
jgi:succinate dehydrogenase / fumarate reductase, membrane anchor subunit